MLVKKDFNKGIVVEEELVSRRLVDLCNVYSRELIIAVVSGDQKNYMIDIHLNNLSATYPEAYLRVCNYMFFSKSTSIKGRRHVK